MSGSSGEFVEYLEKLTPSVWIADEKERKHELNDSALDLTKIPLINSNALHHLRDGQLVRFRGMIQDMHNPEFYLETFETVNKHTGSISKGSGKYRDISEIPENESLVSSSTFKSEQRYIMIVTSIPGFNEWAQRIENEQNDLQLLNNCNQPSTSHLSQPTSNLKRSYDEEPPTEHPTDETERTKKERRKSTEIVESVNKLTLSTEHILNFPIPDVPSKSCIIKFYDDSLGLKLNEMVEVIGFLSVDGKLNVDLSEEKSALTDFEEDLEVLTHNPPPSLVPRLHAIHLRRLQHCNPLLDKPLKEEISIVETREKLKLAFTELLLGDTLAAEYLICHLVSCVYLRKDILALGQFTLNLSNMPSEKSENYTKELYNIIKELVTKSYYLPLTLENMNAMTLIPKKDYNCNRLTSGLLQLSKNTHLILDETKLETGQLDATGVQNVASLANTIKTQKVKYDLVYTDLEMDCDIPMLVLSEGKSLLPCDSHIPLIIDEGRLIIFNEIVEAARHFLKPSVLRAIRIYMTKIQNAEYSIKEEHQFVQDDFIEMRRNSPEGQAPTADDLHKLLVLGRLISVSMGYDTLHKECWDIAKNMEQLRLQRIPKTTTSVLSAI